jgi:class 3 adenylate cyclase
MTRRSDDLDIEERVVIVFDICSSSAILEDLLATNNVKVFRNLLISIKSHLRTSGMTEVFTPYKFIGDGWVILCSEDVSGVAVVTFLVRLSEVFATKFHTRIAPLLQSKPKVIGLTFGVDKGPLVKIEMNQQVEYIGRPLNVASRLQGAIKAKGKDDNPAYKVLFTKNAFHALELKRSQYKFKPVKRRLRNIWNNQEITLMKLKLPLPDK